MAGYLELNVKITHSSLQYYSQKHSFSTIHQKNVQMLITEIFKEEIYNIINSYYQYTSIPKSSFNKIDIPILPINTGKKYLKYSIHFTYICDYQPL